MDVEERSTFYLRGRINGVELWVPAETLVALFTLQYCKDPAVNVVIVEEDSTPLKTDVSKANIDIEKDDCEADEIFPVEIDTLSFDITVKDRKGCPELLNNCFLPAVLKMSEPWCVAGLCSSLRFMLQCTAEIQPNHHSQQLLGFRASCLQACAEVSVWTKFCEIESVKMLKTVFTNHYNNEGMVIQLPRDLVRYEHHLQRPPILHNGLKKKQEYIKKVVQDKAEQQQLLTKKMADLPDLDHTYAEGLDMTLADIMLFASFHVTISKLKSYVSLSEVLPLVLKWHTVIMKNHYVEASLHLLSRSVCHSCDAVNVPQTPLKYTVPSVPFESIYKSDRERYKPRWRAFTHQADIDKVLEVLRSGGVVTQYTDHPALDLILPWASYPSAVNPEEGQLPPSRLERKRHQLENIVSVVQRIAKCGDVIVDYCAGGGHVGIVLAYTLPQCKIIFVENKENSLVRAKQRVERLNLKNVTFIQCNLDYFKGHFDIGVSLHACGVATDLVMHKCLQQKATFICSPCCYGAVQANHILEYPRSSLYRDLPLSMSAYLTLGHAADQTHDQHNPKTSQGQECMRFLDHDRLTLARELGYCTRLVLMQPPHCSPKNHLLIGTL